MSIVECKACEKTCDADIEHGAYIYSKRDPDYPSYLCERCHEKALMEVMALQSAQEDYYKAKRRGEL